MPETDRLFPEYQLLSWLPDETFFSLVSRHHQLWGHVTSAQTCQLIFGSARAGTHHDLPNSLGAFTTRTNGSLGEVDSISRERTLLKFYAAFAQQDETENAVACMSSSSVAHLKLRLGILTSRFRANHPLKACPQCMEQDLRETGWAYWHLKHQFPGVWMCTTHKQPLLQSALKANGVERFQWLLPRFSELNPACVAPIETVSSSVLLSLAELIEHLVQSEEHQPLLPGKLHEVYRQELQARDWIAGAASLRTGQIATAFLNYCEPLRRIPEFDSLAEDEEGMATQLGRLLRPPRSGTHPLRHLLLIHWLFGDAQRFDFALKSEDAHNRAPILDDVLTALPVVDPRIDRLCSLIQEEGQSVRKAANLVGVDPQTALVWAAKAGIAISRRPQKLSTNVRAKAIRDLRRGTDKEKAASKAGVSVGSITRLLLSDAKLHADWSAARSAKARAHSRALWLQLLQSSGSLGIKWMRQLDPRTYMWLYRNDRAWLDANKPDLLPATLRPRPSVVDWEARDEQLRGLVREAALRLMEERDERRIHFWQLCQQIPDLRAKRASLHRLPRTFDAIQAVLTAHLPSQDLFR
ncbi:TnsD family Tn7-like transposition protein [Acidovorax sp. SUPP2539]|uniref:TnsD family Tn7-like transposition protein n=1 Tax=Acidovorax sp. SUPP2539 TaxID=2920878 RepID=UPI0023DE4FA0|nr:TnsD family Tn7-like transposition protein [Acidovorax sp. SUPP2539]GKS91915.1 TniQ family protein [Acidovorax sp. SUPP2539]